MTEELHWYCVRTKPKNEKLSSQLLRTEVGIDVFCPFLRFERARSTGRMWVTEAMFPTYVFARFPYAERNRQIRAVTGITGIVAFGQAPAIIPDTIIEDLRSGVQDQETIKIEPQIETGAEVNVIEGPFRGLRAVVSRVMPARDRIALLLEVLGMEREVEVSSSMVLPDVPHPMSKGQR